MAKNTKNRSFNDFNIKELTEIQEALRKKKTITPREAGILLEVSTDMIYSLISSNKISAFKPFGNRSCWRVDVAKTLEMIGM